MRAPCDGLTETGYQLTSLIRQIWSMNTSATKRAEFFFSPRTKATENGRQRTRFAAELAPGEFRTTLPENAYCLKYLI